MRPITSLYMVWARTKAEAIGKATALATEDQGEPPVRVDAERFPEGKDYRVNWKCLVILRYEVDTAQ